jgi:hypothetical protein
VPRRDTSRGPLSTSYRLSTIEDKHRSMPPPILLRNSRGEVLRKFQVAGATAAHSSQDRESGNQIGFRVSNIAWFKLKHCCPLGTSTWQKRRVFLQNLSTRNRPGNVVLSVRLVLSALHYLTHIPRQESQPTSPGEKRDSLRCP